MMSESTMKAFEEMKKTFGNEPFVVEKVFGISRKTFFKYYKEAGIKEVTARKEWTLEEVVKELNDCSGNDCYDCSWNFIIENGKVYDTWKAFQFI